MFRKINEARFSLLPFSSFEVERLLFLFLEFFPIHKALNILAAIERYYFIALSVEARNARTHDLCTQLKFGQSPRTHLGMIGGTSWSFLWVSSPSGTAQCFLNYLNKKSFTGEIVRSLLQPPFNIAALPLCYRK